MTEIFMLIATLPDVPKPINKLPGCYERELPDGWRVSVNGHGHEMKDSTGKRVPPFEAFFVHNKTLAMAIVSPFGGSTVGDCEDAIVDALRKAGATLP